MTRRIWVVAYFALGFVLGVWVERADLTPVVEDVPETVYVQPATDAVPISAVSQTQSRWVQAPMKARAGSFLAKYGHCRYEDVLAVLVDYPGRRYRCVHVDDL